MNELTIIKFGLLYMKYDKYENVSSFGFCLYFFIRDAAKLVSFITPVKRPFWWQG